MDAAEGGASGSGIHAWDADQFDGAEAAGEAFHGDAFCRWEVSVEGCGG